MSLPPADPEAHPSIPGPTPISEWEVDRVRQSVRQCQFLANTALVGLVILALTATVFIYHQLELLSAQTAELAVRTRALAGSFQHYQTNDLPQHAAFVRAMQDYAATQPEFAATLDRFNQALHEIAANNSTFSQLVRDFPPPDPTPSTNSPPAN
ncbi:MAG: hypothetical protein H7A45_01595 [Verrucomicrobiales bacterium]|nr:hypothetical protein [Verrucomicrobiales bacterium]